MSSVKEIVFNVIAEHAKSASLALNGAPTMIITWAPGHAEHSSYVTVGPLNTGDTSYQMECMREAIIALQDVADRTAANLAKLENQLNSTT